MHHDVTLIATLAIAFVLASVLGYLANRLRLPPLVGYLMAGVVMGSYLPGYTADTGLAGQLAEIGVILLMFGVGLHFSLASLLAVRRIAIAGAAAQIIGATALVTLVVQLWNWSLGAGLVLGLALSVASTVVLVKALEERNAIATTNGRITVGWLVVEDLAMVIVLVLLPALAPLLGGTGPQDAAHGAGHPLWLALTITLLKFAAFAAIALLVGPRVLPWVLRQVARTGSRELFTLAVLTLSIGIAFGAAALFDVSFALGAFFAGMVLNESDLSHKAAANSLPLQDAFAVLFFVSVGMLFDPTILVREPLLVATVVWLIVVGKGLIAPAVVLALGYPLSTALLVAGALAQVGEFSFILAGLGIMFGLLPREGMSLIVAGALISITLNPFVLGWMIRLSEKLATGNGTGARLEARGAPAMAKLEEELHEAERRAAEHAKAHKVLTPEELGERVPLFASLGLPQREVVILHFRPLTAEPGHRVIRIGDAPDGIYFISEGMVEVRTPHQSVKLGPGDFFGEMALISGQPRSANVTALDYCRFMKLSTSDFHEILRRYPELRAPIAQLAAQREAMNRESAQRASRQPGD